MPSSSNAAIIMLLCPLCCLSLFCYQPPLLLFFRSLWRKAWKRSHHESFCSSNMATLLSLHFYWMQLTRWLMNYCRGSIRCTRSTENRLTFFTLQLFQKRLPSQFCGHVSSWVSNVANQTIQKFVVFCSVLELVVCCPPQMRLRVATLVCVNLTLEVHPSTTFNSLIQLASKFHCTIISPNLSNHVVQNAAEESSLLNIFAVCEETRMNHDSELFEKYPKHPLYRFPSQARMRPTRLPFHCRRVGMR